MTDKQVYDIIENTLNKWDTLNKDAIKKILIDLLPPLCPKCNERWGTVQKYGRELDPDAVYDAASTLYSLCPNCEYIYSYTY